MSSTRNSQLAIIGAGSYGTALALTAARAGSQVRLWAHSREVAEMLCAERENKVYLPGHVLPESIQPTNDLLEALQEAEMVLIVVPSHVLRETIAKVADHLRPEMTLVSATKGLEVDTGMRVEEIISDVLHPYFKPKYVALSGPSFAAEVAKDEPCAIVAASHLPEAALAVQETFSTPRFRVYTNTDVVGVEIGGAIKNVMAIATGTVAGLGLGYNSAAALVTRGLAEMTRLAVRMGGRAETLAGLAGMGDLVLTCFGNLSRNRRVGYELGQGKSLDAIIQQMREVAEGVRTAKAAHELAAKLNVEMPITTGVYRMLYDGVSPRDLMIELMERPLKSERA
jgi:glycerol-3-phosphate dehydrogenase (NAD(P)+)